MVILLMVHIIQLQVHVQQYNHSLVRGGLVTLVVLEELLGMIVIIVREPVIVYPTIPHLLSTKDQEH
jgi:hypothetical protein